MLHDLRPQHVEGDVLVIPSGDKDDLLVERPQPRDGAGRAGGDGVVVVPHAPVCPHQLDAVLHAAEFPGKIADDLIRHQTVHGGDSRHVVLHVVHAGNFDVPGGHDDPFVSSAAADDVLAPQEHAVGHFNLPAEQPGASRRPVGLLRGDIVVCVEHSHVLPALVAEDILLGGHILRHVPVNVQMVGCQIGHDGDVGAVLHGHQLEAGQLQHRVVRSQHPVRLAQQRVADVAAHPHALSGSLQQLGDNGRGGGFPVRAGNGDDGTRADLKEHLHLAGEHGAPVHAGGNLRHVRTQAGGAEDHVRVQVLQIVRAQMQLTAQLLQMLRLLAHLLPAALVAGGDADALRQQQLQQRRVADADADDCHGLVPQALYIVTQSHVVSLRLTHYL